MSNLNELLARVKEAEGPDRETDGAIALQLEGWTFVKMNGDQRPYYRKPSDYAYYMRQDGPPKYTGSIDAALGLVERVLPEVNCTGYDEYPGLIEASISKNRVASGHWMHEGFHPTSIPLAFLIALLSALIAREAHNG